MIEYLNNLADRWMAWEVDMLWQVGVIVAIVFAVDVVIRKWAWPQVRYAMWMLVFIKLVMPVGMSSPLSLTSKIPPLSELRTQSIETVNLNTENNVQNTSHSIYTPMIANKVTKEKVSMLPAVVASAPVKVNTGSESIEIQVNEPGGNKLSWKVWAMFVWTGGVVVLGVWLVVRLTRLRNEHSKSDHYASLPEWFDEVLAETAERLQLKKLPKVVLTDKVKCPAVFGVFDTALLMPAGKIKSLSRFDAEHILLHELAHIKRGDLKVHAACMCLQIIYWFNPLLWLIRRPVQNLREICCDGTVAQILTDKTNNYRMTLLETARELLADPIDPGLGLLGLFENSSRLIERLKWLEKNTWRRRPLKIATIIVIVCVMFACVLPMAKAGEPEFVIHGTVIDEVTRKPITGAKVGDFRYNGGRFFGITDSQGYYSYKTWYEEHGIKAFADGYKGGDATILTRLSRSEKERVIDFELEPLTLVNAPSATQPTPTKPKKVTVNSDTIVNEGVGFEDFVVGDARCTKEFIISKLGTPQEDELGGTVNGYFVNYRDEYGIDFWLSKDNVLREIRLNRGFNGKLASGVSMSSSKSEVLNVYGLPLETKETDRLSRKNDDQVLYHSGKRSRIFYEKLGVLVWFEGNSVNQIVVFPAVPSRVNNPREPLATKESGLVRSDREGAAEDDYAFMFDGERSYVKIEPSEQLNIKRSLTLAAWVKCDRNNDGQIMWRGDNRGGKDPYELHLFGGKMEFRVDLLEGTSYRVQSREDVDTDWHHWAGVYDTEDKSISLYMDGKLEAKAGAPVGIEYETSTMWNMIGVADFGNWQYFKGTIDDVKIWKKALSESEVVGDFKGHPKREDSALVGYWDFNEEQGEYTTDKSGNNNHGKIGLWEGKSGYIPPGQQRVFKATPIGRTYNAKAGDVKYDESFYKALTSEGVGIELLGICQQPSEGKQWRHPDGTAMERPYKKLDRLYEDENYEMYEVLFSISGPKEKFVKPLLNDSVKGCNGLEPIGDEAEGITLKDDGLYYSTVLSFEPGAEFGDITLLVGSDDIWKTDTKIETDSNRNITDKSVAGLSAIITSPIATTDGKVYAHVSYTASDNQYRIVAIDNNAKIHSPASSSSMTRNDTGLTMMKIEFDMPIENIKAIEFQTQEFTEVTFKNVYLKPSKINL